MSSKKELALGDNERLDDVIVGGLQIIQSREGYRFTLDAVLLAHFPDLAGVNEVVDLGTGGGIIPLLLSVRSEEIRITGIELLQSAAERATRNIVLNCLTDRIKIIEADINNVEEMLLPSSIDLVLCNPPFWRMGEGRINKNYEIAVARHEITINLTSIIQAAHWLLNSGGRLCLIQRTVRLNEVINGLKQQHFGSIRVKQIHSFADQPPVSVLIEAKKDTDQDIEWLDPVIIYEQQGVYTEQIKGLYSDTSYDPNHLIKSLNRGGRS